MKTITLLNEKGGVGKTSLATHIAAGLAIRGMRVVLVDADAQANSTTQMQLAEAPGLHDLLVREAEWKDVLMTANPDVWAGEAGAKGQLFVLPSDIETRVIPMLVDDAMLMRERLDDLRDWADVTVIDTSPTPSMLHAMLYVASDYMIYPTKCELLSLEGLNKSQRHMAGLNKHRAAFGLPEAELMGIQPTLYDLRTNAHDYGLGLLRENFHRKAWNALPVRTIWRDCGWARKTLFAYALPSHEVLKEVWAMVDRVQAGMQS
jgi:chromosome partitioning protein